MYVGIYAAFGMAAIAFTAARSFWYVLHFSTFCFNKLVSHHPIYTCVVLDGPST